MFDLRGLRVVPPIPRSSVNCKQATWVGLRPKVTQVVHPTTCQSVSGAAFCAQQFSLLLRVHGDPVFLAVPCGRVPEAHQSLWTGVLCTAVGWRLLGAGHPVLDSQGCHEKSQLGGLNQQKFILSQLGRPETRNQGVGRASFSLETLGENSFLSLAALGGSCVPWLVAAHLPLSSHGLLSRGDCLF